MTSAMSELDINSDSDWLDISSGRGSDDNDSLSDQDSDCDGIGSMPSRSRRSSFSTESSMGGDVDAWDGFVSDSGDEAVDALTRLYPAPLQIALASYPAGLIPNTTESIDPTIAEEDKRVKEALDQSFVGTLTASRSSASGLHESITHTSIHDLRLSFPDPLTSSRDELNRSYEDVTPPVPDTISEDKVGVVELPAQIPSSLPLGDPGFLSATPEVPHHEIGELEHNYGKELDVILYGISSEIKWTLVEQLLQKVVLVSGHDFVNSLVDGHSVQSLHLTKKPGDHTKFFDTINIFDFTDEGICKGNTDEENISRNPSLAIVYLPTTKLPIIGLHDSFLPVLVPSAPRVDGENLVTHQAAEDDLELLAIPPARILQFGSSGSLIFNSDDLPDVNPAHAYGLLCNIGQEAKKAVLSRPLTEKLKSVNAVTLFGLMSVVVGFAFNSILHPPTPSPTPTVNSPSSSSGQLWQIVAPQPNRSVIGSSTGCDQAKGCVASNSFDQMGLSIYDARTTSISITSSASCLSLIVSGVSKSVGGTSPKSSKSKLATSGQGSSTDDIIHSSTTSLSEILKTKTALSLISSSNCVATRSPVPNGVNTIAPATSSPSNLNFKSVSEALDASAKALTDVLARDFSNLVEAADDFVSSVLEQTDNVIHQSKGKARALGERIQNFKEEVNYRNERAKKRATELRKMGHDIVIATRGELKERTDRARTRARQLKQSVLESEVWKTCGKDSEDAEGPFLCKAVRKNSEVREQHRELKENEQNARTEKENNHRSSEMRRRGFRVRRHRF